jgi:hypothetical protein
MAQSILIPSSFYTMLLLMLTVMLANRVHGFGGVSMTPLLSTRTSITSSSSRTTTLYANPTTIEPPVREKTDRKTNAPSKRSNDKQDDEDEGTNDKDANKYGDLEYLIDEDVSREMDDPFHILLLGSTFDKPKITVPYCAGSLEYVLNMPNTEATELSNAAEESGISCLGTWPREMCLSLGKKLQVRDLVCRVVPYVQGGQRGWQAKDANDANYSGAGRSSDEDYN